MLRVDLAMAASKPTTALSYHWSSPGEDINRLCDIKSNKLLIGAF